MIIEDIGIRTEKVLNKVRHYLQEDNGDVEFVRFEPETETLVLRFLGECSTCALQMMTLRAGLERFILKEIPEVRRVEKIN
jgi:Fe-S cluster biogenesis protein NfuA